MKLSLSLKQLRDYALAHPRNKFDLGDPET